MSVKHVVAIVYINCLFGFLALQASALPYENEYGPEYGDEWIMFIDDNGTTHTMNFSTLPTDNRGMVFGDAYFYLYTRQNLQAEQLRIPENGEPLISTYFNRSNKIKVITHGWLSGENTKWLHNIKNSFLSKENYNVISIDWSELADNPIYPWSAFSTRYVGKRLAKLLSALVDTYALESRNMHLIGHSLGAQVMGYAGMYSKYKVGRITGLDPARPLFEVPYMGPDFRLEKSDAEFVDIIHSCGGVYGYKRSHGHADFYPNNGKPRQPGCEGAQQVIESCSHGRSFEFFEESILSNISFVSYPCESWNKFENGECKEDPAKMGYPAQEDNTGDYYLYTRDKPNYAIEE